MAKLYFRYGTMNSAKTLNLLAVSHNYKSQGKKVIIMKPHVDNRFGDTCVKSRTGLSEETNHIVSDNDNILEMLAIYTDISCVLVDECQFLSFKNIEELRLLTDIRNVPVICFGLRTDFQTKLFPGSHRLFELADSIEEIKTVCHRCTKKALFNMRFESGIPTNVGPQVQLGLEDKYEQVCSKCYLNLIGSF